MKKTNISVRNGSRRLWMSVCVIAAAVILAVFAPSRMVGVRAATLTVTNTNDSGAGSLRDAVAQANSTAADDTINFAIPASDPNCNSSGVCTITLTSGELAINNAATAGKLTITNSTGASKLLISGNNTSRVFFVNSGGNLTLDGVTVTKGNGTGATIPSRNGGGGGIENYSGILTLTNSVVSGNTAQSGGGIENYNGAALALTNSTVSGNTAQGGGGIYNYKSSRLTLTNSTVSNNQAPQNNSTGGGIDNSRDSTTTLTNSTVSGNTAYNGGGISNRNGAALTVTNSTVSNNAATGPGNTGNGCGGGIQNYGGGGDSMANVTGSIITGNTGGFGGGLCNYGTVNNVKLTITNSTVSNNMSSGSGGGIENTTVAMLIVNYSTINGNTALSGGGIDNFDSVTATITNSTVSNNQATQGSGGGIASNSNFAVSLTNSTVSGNTALKGGGGIDSEYPSGSSTLSLTSVTVTNNRVTDATCTTSDFPQCAGGIFHTRRLADADLRNTIVAGNTAANASASPDFNGKISATSSYNLIGNNQGMTGITNGTSGNQVGTPASPIDPRLAPLRSNGGATQTHAPLPDSPAIDKGKNFAVDANNNQINTDQRGLPRPVDLPNYPNAAGGDGSDIGAFEMQSAALDANPIDDPTFFVTQHYRDFLNREPDQAGLNFWTGEINSCGTDARCIDNKRQNVSAAYFLSTEFQETGFFVIRMQRAAFGKTSNDAAKRITFQQFLTDSRAVGRGVVGGQAGADQLLEQNKTAYAQMVVSSAEFTAKYSSTLTAAQFVDALYQTAGVAPQGSERQEAINSFGGGDTAGRAAALRKVAESASVKQAEFSPAFVLLQYFGYLRRNPTDAPDTSDAGYQFWLAKLNSFNGDYIRSEMVRSFILSSEYRRRFGSQ